ncbi:MAG: alcohol dehydrogenase, partial [Actinomycetota bacterium]
MKAFVITGPRQARVAEVDPPVAGPGLVVVDVERAGVGGTDVELFTGEMEYFAQG